jgi:hypothetical protein
MTKAEYSPSDIAFTRSIQAALPSYINFGLSAAEIERMNQLERAYAVTLASAGLHCAMGSTAQRALGRPSIIDFLSGHRVQMNIQDAQRRGEVGFVGPSVVGTSPYLSSADYGKVGLWRGKPNSSIETLPYQSLPQSPWPRGLMSILPQLFDSIPETLLPESATSIKIDFDGGADGPHEQMPR